MGLFSTDRLSFRIIDERDYSNARILDTDPLVMMYLNGGNPKTKLESEETVQRLIDYQMRDGYSFWAVQLIDDQTFMGWAGLKHIEDSDKIEIGYSFASAYWNKGYATEASLGILEYGFKTLNLDVIYGRVDANNLASVRVLEKIGMTQYGKSEYKGFSVELFGIAKEKYTSSYQ